MISIKNTKPFYKTKRWKRIRESILRNAEYICQESKRYGNTHMQANTVHHIYFLEDYPELALVRWNLLAVNGDVHNTFHNREDGSPTAIAIYWQRKRKKEFEEWKAKHPPTS